MDITKNSFSFSNISYPRYALFWVCIFLYFFLTTDIIYYNAGYIQMFESILLIVIGQFMTAHITLFILAPKFLDKNKLLHFFCWLFATLVVVFAIYVSIRSCYYNTKYLAFFPERKLKYITQPLLEQLLNFSTFISKCIKFITPTAILLMYRFYKNQQQFLKINEQKKIAELAVLKQQLNPHFLFNTLNNLYALTLKKSDQAPLIIEKLSNILDYMLYRCADNFVPLQKEIELIENYIVLEKIRYGKRVEISFDNQVSEAVKIAPLLLLTFIENAFKHGVTQELKQAVIKIDLRLENDLIVFIVKNSKPLESVQNTDKQSIGLSNVRKQLELLYPDAYELDISNEKEHYTIILKLASK